MIVYLSLGANLGNREQTLSKAVDLIAAEAGKVNAVSDYFYSEPWGFKSPHGFCNICIRIQTELTLTDLLHVTQHIEQRLGRTQKSINGVYHDRTIDIDIILAYDDNNVPLSVHNDTLVVPHPLWKERDFVLKPLMAIKSAEHIIPNEVASPVC